MLSSIFSALFSALLSPITNWLAARAQRQQGAATQQAADDAVALKDAANVEKADAAAGSAAAIRKRLLNDSRP